MISLWRPPKINHCTSAPQVQLCPRADVSSTILWASSGWKTVLIMLTDSYVVRLRFDFQYPFSAGMYEVVENNLILCLEVRLLCSRRLRTHMVSRRHALSLYETETVQLWAKLFFKRHAIWYYDTHFWRVFALDRFEKPLFTNSLSKNVARPAACGVFVYGVRPS